MNKSAIVSESLKILCQILANPLMKNDKLAIIWSPVDCEPILACVVSLLLYITINNNFHLDLA